MVSHPFKHKSPETLALSGETDRGYSDHTETTGLETMLGLQVPAGGGGQRCEPAGLQGEQAGTERSGTVWTAGTWGGAPPAPALTARGGGCISVRNRAGGLCGDRHGLPELLELTEALIHSSVVLPLGRVSHQTKCPNCPRGLLTKINGTYIQLLGIRPVLSICSKIHTTKFFSVYSPSGLIHTWTR